MGEESQNRVRNTKKRVKMIARKSQNKERGMKMTRVREEREFRDCGPHLFVACCMYVCCILRLALQTWESSYGELYTQYGFHI